MYEDAIRYPDDDLQAAAEQALAAAQVELHELLNPDEIIAAQQKVEEIQQRQAAIELELAIATNELYTLRKAAENSEQAKTAKQQVAYYGDRAASIRFQELDTRKREARQARNERLVSRIRGVFSFSDKL